MILYVPPFSSGMVLERPSIMQSDDSSVIERFLTTWTKNPQSGPRQSDIRAVFSIRNATVERKFQEYLRNLRGPNVGMFYHGTVLQCDILHSRSLCDNYSCSVCGISRRGFDTERIRSHVKFQRFGHAFYLGENSSKCHEYSEGYNGVRALLYCKVAMGNRYYAPTDEPNMTAPPLGYDSVFGQKGTHHGGSGSLNYNEVAIYGISEAILPMYIIVYQNNGVKLLL